MYHMHQIIMKDEMLMNIMLYMKWNQIDNEAENTKELYKLFEENPEKIREFLRTAIKKIPGTGAHAKWLRRLCMAIIF